MRVTIIIKGGANRSAVLSTILRHLWSMAMELRAKILVKFSGEKDWREIDWPRRGSG